MTHTNVESSWIKRISYDPKNQVLEMETKSGKRYRAEDVHPDHHAEFIGAESHGAHFNSAMKGKYEFKPVKDE